MIHGDLKGQNVHVAYSFEYATVVARDAATGLIVNDEGKFCRVLSDNSIWMLSSSAPLTWVGIASGVNTGSSATANSGISFPVTPLNYEFFYRTDLDNVFIWNPIVSSWVDVTAAVAGGDMLKVNYDPTNVNADVFAMDNMIQGTFNLFISVAEKAKIAAAEVVSNKGSINGYASLDANREVVQLPSGAAAAATGTVLRQDGSWVLISGTGGGGGSSISVFSQSQIAILTPTNGQVVFNSTSGTLQVWVSANGAWETFSYNSNANIQSGVYSTSIVTIDGQSATPTSYFFELDASAASINLTLPSATSNIGKVYVIKAKAITNGASVTPSAGTIENLNSFVFQNINDSITVISDGTNWRITASNITDIDIVYNLSGIQSEIMMNTYNIAMNTYRIMSYDAMSKYNMVDGIFDEYKDLLGVNVVNSGYSYDAANNFLFNTSTDPEIDNFSKFGTTAHFGTVQNATGNVGGSNPGQTFQIHGDQLLTKIKLKMWASVSNPFDPVGTGVLSLLVIRLPAGQSINQITDNPTWADFHNPALLVAKIDMTEAQMAANIMPMPTNVFLQNAWFEWKFAVPTLFTDGDYAFIIDRVTSPLVGWYTYSKTISQTFNEGRALQAYTSGMVFHTHNMIYAIEAKSDTVSNNPVMNRSHTNSMFSSNSNNLAWGTGLNAIPFRLTTNTLIENIKMSFISTPSYPMDGTGAGSYRFAIQSVNNTGGFVDTGGVAEKTALKRWGSAIDPAYDLISETLTEPQLAAIAKNYTAEPYLDNFATIKADLAANNQVPFSVVNFTNPTTLPPGEYFLIIDNVANPISQILYYLVGRSVVSTVDNYIGGGIQQIFTSGLTSVEAMNPLFAIGGKSLGDVSNMIIEGVANTVTTSPTKLYFSAIVNSSILLTDLDVEISKDSGTTWIVLSLSEITNSNNTVGTKMIYGTHTFTSTTGVNVIYRVSSLNLAAAELHASSLQWR